MVAVTIVNAVFMGPSLWSLGLIQIAHDPSRGRLRAASDGRTNWREALKDPVTFALALRLSRLGSYGDG
jgi:hypothetical protein